MTAEIMAERLSVVHHSIGKIGDLIIPAADDGWMCPSLPIP